MALPITQHARIWERYLLFARRVGGITAVRIWKRYLKMESSKTEAYVDLLLEIDPPRYAEAARVISSMVENPQFKSKKKKTTHQLWTELCDLICEHPDEMDMQVEDVTIKGGESADERLGIVQRLDVDRILRCGISKFSDQVGKLWVALASYWTLKDEVEKARDVFEEAISKVATVQDFSICFDAYAKFAEYQISAKMELLEERNEGGVAEEISAAELELDMEMARFERLIERRPFLVNDVLLRQNSNNVSYWEKRVQLYKTINKPDLVAQTFNEAVQKIQPRRADGKLYLLWVHFAQFYEERDDIETARSTFEKAIKVNFKRVDDLAEVWCQWAEMELRKENFDIALEVMGRATTPPRGTKSGSVHTVKYQDESLSPQTRLFKSLKLWSFYVDLEESIGTTESTKVIYDRIMELKIANAQVLCNYAAFLEENNWFEESYKVYERGIEVFGYPTAFDIWTLYLNKFVKRFGGTKLERTRELFESAVEKVPPKYAKTLYMMYAKLEEDFGLARHSMRIYDRASKNVSDEDRYDTFLVYIAKATQFFGVTSTREIYEKALEILPDKRARDMCLKFCELELSLGEVDRARAIFGYGSQFSDPRNDSKYWKNWQEFEVKHGNEDTFKEMLRIKRSVQAKFNSEVSYISAQIIASKEPTDATPKDSMEALMAELEQETAAAEASSGGSRVVGFVRAKVTEKKIEPEEGEGANPDEIELEDSDDEDMGSGEDEVVVAKGKEKIRKVEEKQVPSAVFGGLAEKVKEAREEEEKLGAKERLKRKRGEK